MSFPSYDGKINWNEMINPIRVGLVFTDDKLEKSDEPYQSGCGVYFILWW